MKKSLEYNRRPDQQKQEKQPLDARQLAEEILRLCELAEGFGVPVVLETRDDTRIIWPDRRTTVYPKRRRKALLHH